jgi:predicted transcriptional regulator
MTALSLRLPESLHRKLSELAEREGVSINELISEYLAARAARGSRRKFAAVLAKVPDVEPDENDRIPKRRKK